MRTKTLLLTVALVAAGAASSMAQVYSQNAVGYINLNLPQGFSMIANQLKSGGNTLAEVIPNPPPGTLVYKLVGANFVIGTFDEFDLNWGANAGLAVPPGTGLFIALPNPATVTFVGEVPQGSLSTPTPTGFSLVGSQVPQAGPVTDLNLIAGPGDTIYKFANNNYSIFTFDEFDLAWTPSIPNLAVGEGIYLNRVAGSPATWARTFSVN